MKQETKNALFNAIYYSLIVGMIIGGLCMIFQFGAVKGLTEAYKEQLKEQIRLLEQRNEEIRNSRPIHRPQRPRRQGDLRG